MRIIAGIYKGFKLQTFTGNNIRPTPSKVREAIFSIIGARVTEAEFLDLFAGTGAVGIEAISRGAKEVTFVEIDKKATDLIKKNLKKIKQNGVPNIIKIDCLKALELLNLNQKKIDIIFLDPPYYEKFISAILQKIEEINILQESGLIVVQHSARINVKGNYKKLSVIKEKKYGNTKITVLKKL